MTKLQVILTTTQSTNGFNSIYLELTANKYRRFRLLQLKIAAKVMITVNIHIQDRLINNETGNITNLKFVQGKVRKVFLKFTDEQADLKAMESFYLTIQNSWFLTKKCETEIPIKSNVFNFP